MTNQIEVSEHPLSKTATLIAIAALVFALVSIASSAIFIRFSEEEISPWATVFNRFWITTVALGLWNGFFSLRCHLCADKPVKQEPYSGWVWVGLLAVGTFFCADLILWAWSLTQTSVANSTLLANLTPLFTTLGAWLVWGKRFDSRFLMGMCIAIGGAVGLGVGDLQLATGKVQGDIAALLAAVSFAVYLLILEKLQTRLNPITIIFWSSAIAGLLTLPLVLTNQASIFPSSWQGWMAVISLALICQVLGQGLLVYSLNHLSCEFVALFLLLDPVLAAIGAGAFFSERLGLSNWMAFAVVLLGMYLALTSQSAWDRITQEKLTNG
jgi:drug/metabolite transporter (DMT)-like permease